MSFRWIHFVDWMSVIVSVNVESSGYGSHIFDLPEYGSSIFDLPGYGSSIFDLPEYEFYFKYFLTVNF